MVRETATKKEIAFGNFNVLSNVPRRPQHSIVKHRMAHTKINAKKDLKVLDLSKLTLFGIETEQIYFCFHLWKMYRIMF